MLAHNRDTLTERSVASIRRQYPDKDQVQILVVSDKHRGFVGCADQIDLLDVSKIRWWTNPCIPMNLGFVAAKHEKIIFQGGENYHRGDLIQVVRSQLTDDMYLVFGCYSLDSTYSNLDLEKIIPGAGRAHAEGANGWYQHSEWNPRRFHFTAAMTKKTLRRIGGFSEEFALGIAFDDDDFVKKVDEAKIVTLNVDTPYTLHQYHYGAPVHPQAAALIARNQSLYARKWKV